VPDTSYAFHIVREPTELPLSPPPHLSFPPWIEGQRTTDNIEHLSNGPISMARSCVSDVSHFCVADREPFPALRFPGGKGIKNRWAPRRKIGQF